MKIKSENKSQLYQTNSLYLCDQDKLTFSSSIHVSLTANMHDLRGNISKSHKEMNKELLKTSKSMFLKEKVTLS